MPVTIETDRTDTMTLAEFVEHVENQVDLYDRTTLEQLAPQFRALANTPGLVTGFFSEAIKNYFHGGPVSAYTPQSILMGYGKRGDFYVRANIWTPLRLTSAFRSQEERIFSYRNCHDHNFSFMTIGYSGPGYETDLYRFDSTKVRGYLGEEVDMEFVERARLVQNQVMVYHEKEDIHVQYPPEKLSISLNLMVMSPKGNLTDQYFFDPETRRIIGFPTISKIYTRASVVAMAGWLADGDTVDVLRDLMTRAPCRRVREAAVTAVARVEWLPLTEKQRMVEAATHDADPLVCECAHKFLAG